MESYNGILCTKSDALYLIHAAMNELIPLISQRFSNYERQTYIKSGSIFVYCENKSNIKRWTDGKKWSASRVSGVFLSYKEMKPSNSSTCHIIDKKDDGLLKQSFSYNFNGEKFHIISYIDENDYNIKNVNLKRPSLDSRFKDFEIKYLELEDNDSFNSYTYSNTGNKPTNKRQISDYSEEDDEEESDNSDSSIFSHVSKKNKNSVSFYNNRRNSSLSSIDSIPLSFQKLPSITTLDSEEYIRKQLIVLPPLKFIDNNNKSINKSINDNKCELDKKTLLSFKCCSN